MNKGEIGTGIKSKRQQIYEYEEMSSDSVTGDTGEESEQETLVPILEPLPVDPGMIIVLPRDCRTREKRKEKLMASIKTNISLEELSGYELQEGAAFERTREF